VTLHTRGEVLIRSTVLVPAAASWGSRNSRIRMAARSTVAAGDEFAVGVIEPACDPKAEDNVSACRDSPTGWFRPAGRSPMRQCSKFLTAFRKECCAF
jgi:hypothetical protein